MIYVKISFFCSNIGLQRNFKSLYVEVLSKTSQRISLEAIQRYPNFGMIGVQKFFFCTERFCYKNYAGFSNFE